MGECPDRSFEDENFLFCFFFLRWSHMVLTQCDCRAVLQSGEKFKQARVNDRRNHVSHDGCHVALFVACVVGVLLLLLL